MKKTGAEQMWVRNATEEDFPAIVSIQAGQGLPWPERAASPEAMMEADERRSPSRLCRRWIGGLGKGTDGFLSCVELPSYNGERAFATTVAVRPAARGHGLGSRLFATMLEGLRGTGGFLCADGFSKYPRGMAFLEGLGFRETWRETPVELDLQGCRTDSLAALEEELASRDIFLRSAAELAADKDRDRKLYELYWLLSNQVPAEEGYVWEKQPFDEWMAEQMDSPSTLLDAYQVAVHDGDYVGLKEVGKLPGSASIQCGLMGVLPGWQRQGIALAMQLRVIDHAKKAGCAILRSCTATCNNRMQDLYAKLGYIKLYEWAQYMMRIPG